MDPDWRCMDPIENGDRYSIAMLDYQSVLRLWRPGANPPHPNFRADWDSHPYSKSRPRFVKPGVVLPYWKETVFFPKSYYYKDITIFKLYPQILLLGDNKLF